MNINKLKSWFLVALGSFLLAVSVKFFVLPNSLLSGGTANIALILEAVFGFDSTITIDVLVVGQFLLGLVFLGKEFSLKTLISSIVYPIALTLLNYVDYSVVADKILIAIFGGIVAGVGIGIVIREDASTGGTDIPSIIVHKITGVPLHVVFTIVDGVIVVCSILTHNFVDVMYGLIYIYISNEVINKMMVPKGNGAVALFIISDKKQEIMDYIHVALYRGSTTLKANGGYTGDEKQVIMSVVKKTQYNKLMEKITEIDPYAFVIVSDAKDIKGEGFTYEYRV